MKLLIITQKVDRDDPILGFFHRWIEEFAKHFEALTVVCLQEGEHKLPNNVKVYSLGKERGASKFSYILNFYKYIWSLRKDYDAVFVHMNQEYVLLGSLFWKLSGKKIGMWRNHHSGNILTDAAMFLCNVVFCTSKYSYTTKNKKIKIMPVGVDTDLFKKDDDVLRIPKSVLSLGRISPSKRLSLLVESFGKLKSKGVKFTGTIVGDALPEDKPYAEDLVRISSELGLTMVSFQRGVTNWQAPKIYSAHDIFVNLSSSGMYDKTIFEAMACECIVLASNENLRDLIADRFIFKDQDSSDFESKLVLLLNIPDESRSGLGREFRDIVIEKHSLKQLAEKLETEYSILHESHKGAL